MPGKRDISDWIQFLSFSKQKLLLLEAKEIINMIATRTCYDKTCDLDTFSILYQEHGQAANLLALRLTGNRVLAEDAVQEAMLRIWRGLSTLRPGNTRSWVFRIVARECYRLLASTRQDGNRRGSANSIRNTSIPHDPLERLEQEAARTWDEDNSE